MILARTARSAGHAIKAIGLFLALAALPQAALAAPAATAGAPKVEAAATIAAPAAAAPVVAAPVATAPVAGAALAPEAPKIDPNNPRFQIAPGGYTPMAPTPGKGMPVAGGIHLQDQYSPTGEYARWMHDAFLMPIITVITLFVLGLLLFVVGRYNKRKSPVASKTSHNTLLEVIWTGLPILILVAIAVPSVTLIAKQYKPAPATAVTIKATGNQWFWTYTYPDNGGFEVISNMLPLEEAKKRGEPDHLAADFRMVVPAGEPIRLQVTAADVIHAFAVPSLWSKLDAVPGRINEKVLFIKEPGVYFGQCSELCGARHGYMPIVIEALPRPQFEAWVLSQAGGTLAKPAVAGTGAAPPATPAAAPVSAEPVAPAAAAAPAKTAA